MDGYKGGRMILLEAIINSMSFYDGGNSNNGGWLNRIFGTTKKSQLDIIDEFSITIKRGDKLSLIGRNGAGKTTLLRILTGIEKRFKGQVKYREQKLVEPNKLIYLLHQRNTLLPWFSVKQNLEFSASKESKELILKAVEKFSLGKLLDVYPKRLSGGETAKVAFACAYCANPEVLLLDEPFRGLDQLAVESCQELLDEWLISDSNLKAILLVSHSIKEAIYFSSKIVVVGSRPMCLIKEFDFDSEKLQKDASTIATLEKEIKHHLNEV